MMPLRLALTLVTAVALTGSVAEAQIYVSRDANGTLVLSNRPSDRSAETWAVTGSAAIRTTTPPASAPMRERFEPLIQAHSARYNLRPELVRAVIQVESAFDPRARSHKGAMGLMQLMPATAAELGVRDPYDPNENIRGGAAYLRQLLDRYDGDEELALAAYNAGAGAVERYGRSVPPFRETRDYVKKVGSATTVQKDARRRIIYKAIDVVNGRDVPRYTTTKPATGPYDIIVR
jgi:soluble lytic murein transglycosylase-like protein